MRSLRRRAALQLGLWFVAAGATVSALVVYHDRRVGASAEAARAIAIARALETSLSVALDRNDWSDVRDALERAAAPPSSAEVVVVGRSGRVVGARETFRVPQPERRDECVGCHAADSSPAALRREEAPKGEGIIAVFEPLRSRSSCGGCHPSQTDPLGYLLVRVRRPADATLAAVSVVTAGSLTLLFGLGAAALARRLVLRGAVRPLDDLRRRFLDGGGGGEPPGPDGLPSELTGIAEGFTELRRREAAAVRELTASGRELKAWLSMLGDGIATAQEASKQRHGAAETALLDFGKLENAMGSIRGSLNAISNSTSDNSTSLIEMSASIDEVANNADQLAQHVSATSEAVLQMVHSVVEVAGRIEILSRETEGTATSMAQIDASTREIEQHARKAAELGGRVAQEATEGSRVVEESLQGIRASHGVIRQTAYAIGELSTASRAIGGIVKIINEINDKTKLLALNAAIIAAQAGEHGKSFAVVAHEIKNLSDRTASSTGEISRIIGSIQERVEAVTAAVQRGEAATARGVELGDRAGRTLERIQSTAQLTHEMNRQILGATEEQSRGSQAVMASMQEVSAMVAYIRSVAQDHRERGEAVGRNAESMRDLTEQVKLATAEQADVSRYISEAITAIDRNLLDVLQAVEGEQKAEERLSAYLEQGMEEAKRAAPLWGDAAVVAQEMRARIRLLEALREARGEEAEGGA